LEENIQILKEQVFKTAKQILYERKRNKLGETAYLTLKSHEKPRKMTLGLWVSEIKYIIEPILLRMTYCGCGEKI
jgi:hypothetical protein